MTAICGDLILIFGYFCGGLIFDYFCGGLIFDYFCGVDPHDGYMRSTPRGVASDRAPTSAALGESQGTRFSKSFNQ